MLSDRPVKAADPREALAAVLACHIRLSYGRCSCGDWEANGRWRQDSQGHRAHLADVILTHWLPTALADERVHAAVVRAIYGDGLDEAHKIATAALTAAVTALSEETT